jgi:hypothetical protein
LKIFGALSCKVHLILSPALAWLHATAFEGSMAALRMLVVPAAVAVEVATTMAAMLDPTVEPNRASHDREVEAGLAAVSNCQVPTKPTTQQTAAALELSSSAAFQ